MQPTRPTRALAVALAALTLAFAPVALQAARGPSTAEERAKAVEVARMLEKTPWSEEATAARQWLGTFLAEAPDISVKRCLSLFGPPAERSAIPAALLDQQMFSSAAYQLEHPDTGAGATATLLAGLEGSLAAYSAWRAHGGLEAVAPLETLAAMRQKGELEIHVREAGRRCR
jgi:hypothetical protein